MAGGIIMGFFDDLGATLTQAGQRANEFSDVTRLNARTNELNRSLQELYRKLGQEYYKLHSAQPEPDLTETCGAITRAREELDHVRAELLRIRQIKIKVCPNCGFENASAARFCCKCSTPLSDPTEPKETGPVCPACGTQMRQGARFCTQCGTQLSAAAEPEKEKIDLSK